MDRRTYLRLLGLGSVTAAAGCLGGEESAPGTTATDKPTRTPERDVPTDSPATAAQDGESTDTDAVATETDATADADDTTATPPDVTTPVPGECEAEAPPSPDPPEGFPEPRDYPETPESMTVDDVRPFLQAYERAHRYNRVLADLIEDVDCLESIEVWGMGSTVAQTADGVTGTVSTQAAYTEEACRTVTGTDTPTPMPHGDLYVEDAQYYVTDRFLIREGTVLECWG